MATFVTENLYLLDQHGSSSNGVTVQELIPDSTATSQEQLPNVDGVLKPGEQFSTDFANLDLATRFGGSFTYIGTDLDVAGIVASDSHGNFFLFSNDGTIPDGTQLNKIAAVPVPICFAAGTLIRTLRGDVAIETLKASDLVVTGSGEVKPIKWVGHRVVDCRSHSNPRAALPVRIAADAFGPGRPSRDLFVSPAHSICLDLCGEVLIHAANLVNGATITQVEVEEIDYWHVELDSHDILIANNLAAESYLEMGNRGFFAEAGATLDDDAARLRTYADFCRPVVLDGPVLQFVRERLTARAEAIGWTPCRDADMQVVVDGESCRPLTDGETSIFRFPASARDVRLQSNTFVPVGGGDPRALGVMLRELAVSAGRGEETRAIALSDPRIQDGLYPEEGQSGVVWRWTTGDLKLSPDLWAGLSDQITLRVAHDNGAIRRWLAPEHAVIQRRPEPAAHKTKPRAQAVAVRGAA